MLTLTTPLCDSLDSYMLDGVEQNAVEARMRSKNEKWIKTLSFSPYHSETVHLKKYDHVTSFLNAAPIPRNHRAHMFLFKKKVLHLRNIGRKATSVTQMNRSGIFHRENAVREMLWYEKKMSYQDIWDV